MMKEKIRKLIEKFKNHELATPNVLILTAEDLAELRDELGLAPDVQLIEYKNLQIQVIEEAD